MNLQDKDSKKLLDIFAFVSKGLPIQNPAKDEGRDSVQECGACAPTLPSPKTQFATLTTSLGNNLGLRFLRKVLSFLNSVLHYL